MADNSPIDESVKMIYNRVMYDHRSAEDLFLEAFPIVADTIRAQLQAEGQRAS
jgi:hypothetical protein